MNDFIGGNANTEEVPATEIPGGTPVDPASIPEQPPVEAVAALDPPAVEVGTEPKPFPDSPVAPDNHFEVLYNRELLAHQMTKAMLKIAEAAVARAKAMGFSGGAGVHGGA